MWYPGSGVVHGCIDPDLCHLSYFNQSLHCSHTQSMDIGENSEQNVDFEHRRICPHWCIKEVLSHTVKPV